MHNFLKGSDPGNVGRHTRMLESGTPAIAPATTRPNHERCFRMDARPVSVLDNYDSAFRHMYSSHPDADQYEATWNCTDRFSTCHRTKLRPYLDHLKTRSPAMRYSSQIKPISYLKANAAEVLNRIAEERVPLVITQNGEAKAVLQDVASYEETQETLALLKVLALGNADVAAGKVKPVAEVASRLRAKRAKP